MRLNLSWIALGLSLCVAPNSAVSPAFAQEQDEVSPACGDYQRNVIVVDAFVNSPTTVTLEQLRTMPDQTTLNIDFVDPLGAVQHHSETGPLLWTVLDAAGGVQVPPLRAEHTSVRWWHTPRTANQ